MAVLKIFSLLTDLWIIATTFFSAEARTAVGYPCAWSGVCVQSFLHCAPRGAASPHSFSITLLMPNCLPYGCAHRTHSLFSRTIAHGGCYQTFTFWVMCILGPVALLVSLFPQNAQPELLPSTSFFPSSTVSSLTLLSTKWSMQGPKGLTGWIPPGKTTHPRSLYAF